MPDGGESKSDGGVHMCTGDVADGVDHGGNDEATGYRRSQSRHLVFIGRTKRCRPTRHEHQ